MSKYVIVGAGGFGREVACWIGLDQVQGFLDDTFKAGTHLPGYSSAPILGAIREWGPFGNSPFLLAVGDPEGRESVVEIMAGAPFVSFIHRAAFVAETAEVGDGSLIGPFANIAADSHVGRFVHVNGHSGVGHDSKIGDFTTLSSHVDITGRVTVGRSCFFGSRAGVLPGLHVGEGCVIGAGAIAVRNVPIFGTLYEQPPRFLAK